MNSENRKERLVFAMKQTKVRQWQVAEMLGTSQPNIAQIFSRGEIDSIAIVDAVAKLTGYPKIWLMWGDFDSISDDLHKGLLLYNDKFTKRKRKYRKKE